MIERVAVALPTLTIKHSTTYRYRKPVAFGEHTNDAASA